jgi:chromosome segregation protein
MEDVIFAGSDSRGPSAMAEVCLTFDEVGFSHETLAQAVHSEDADAERVLDTLAPVDDPTAEQAAEPAVVPGEATAVFDEHGQPITSAAGTVREFLADETALDFSGYTEVSIARRLYRDGTSQYFINKTPCRLRDVTDFFLGTGVGTKAYSIIEQGRIGQIVSARPVDRRIIIEEAAGITKFKSKKKAAERKLEQTRQNLLRVSDIVTELDKRMGTLRRQAQKAERYRRYKDELRELDLCKASHRFLELRGERGMVDARLRLVRDELSDARTAFDVQDARVVVERAELGLEERRLMQLQEVVYELENQISLGDSQVGFQRKEVAELELRVQQGEVELAELARELAEARTESAGRQQELTDLTVEADQAGAFLREHLTAEADARTAADEAQRSLDQARAELARARTQVATGEAQLEALLRRKGESQRRLERVVEDVALSAERHREIERDQRRVDGELGQVRQLRIDLGNQAEGFTARAELLADKVHHGESQVETLRTENHRRRSRLQSLQEIGERYEGFARGTRAIMQRPQAVSQSDKAIYGLVADVLRAPQSLEVAVEAALGDHLGGVLVENAEVGLRAISYLKASGGGRSAFVPMARVWSVGGDQVGEAGWSHEVAGARPGGSAIEVEDRTTLAAAMFATGEGAEAEVGAEGHGGGGGVLGRMHQLVEFSDGFSTIGKQLLGDCIVVDNVERAVALRERGVTDTLVTVDGDVVDARGVVSGGSREAKGAGVLAQKREIRELEEIVVLLERDLAEATAQLLQDKTEWKQVTKALEGLRSELNRGDMNLVMHERDQTRLRLEHDRLRDRLTQLGSEQLELEERLAAITADEARLGSEALAHTARIGQLETEQLGRIAAVTEGRDAHTAASAALTEARVRSAQVGEKRAAAVAQVRRLELVDRDLVSRSERRTSEIASARTRMAALQTSSAEMVSQLESVRAQRLEQATLLSTGKDQYQRRLAELTAVELASREIRSRVDKLAGELGQLELRLSTVDMNHSVLVEGIWERYQVELAAVLFDYHLSAPSGEPQEVRMAELRELLERMGTDINLLAIDEFAEVSQRFAFLGGQKADLESAVDQLQKAIDKINKTSRRLFRETFQAVNTMFKQVFPRLFRGGQAHLSLTGGDDADLLEAGIEIVAQPPGKKNSTVEQLSGGEKALTAVALIFSIFLIKPSPFCILDEVDAPLDEANVDRYNELVREMTDRSQFIVITHNKRTMESADNLYGVTMQEAGVSKLVSVRLSRIGQNAA